MDKVKLKDFKIIPDINSVRKEDISDEVYFSPAYSGYISNSRLKWIDPKDGGDPAKFQNPPKLKTSSLAIGSCVHECLLQPEEFELGPKIGKPSAKLGEVMDNIPNFLNNGLSLDDAIKQAALKVDYYSSVIDSKIENIKTTWNEYSDKLKDLDLTEKVRRMVCDKDWDVVNGCLTSCTSNEDIMNLLHPKNVFGQAIESHCEDAFFMDYIVIYQGKHCATLNFKMKADNWTIDYDNKVLTLNDLKTTSHPVQNFMKEEGSFYHYSYARQMAVYGEILWYWNMRNHGVSKESGWRLNSNMLVVETIPNYWSKSYYVDNTQLKLGRKMLIELLCRVAYCKMFGWDKEIEFE